MHANACGRQYDVSKPAPQVRRKGKYISNTFRRRTDADAGALETERTAGKGFDPKTVIPSSVKTFGEIIDLHAHDRLEDGKIIRRSKGAVFESLKLTLGNHKLRDITRSALIDYGKKRAEQGAGPATLAIDVSFIGSPLTHAATIYGIVVNHEDVRLAHVTWKRPDLIGDPQERDRCLT